ncbi:MAG: hypothetical protein ABI574_20115, partial [Burkholderiales bacterium]
MLHAGVVYQDNHLAYNSSTDKDSDRWYQYDAMDRQTVVAGVDAAGNLGTVGHKLQYDKNGNRSQDQYYGNKVATSGGETVILGYDEDGSAIYSSAPVTYTTSQGLVT